MGKTSIEWATDVWNPVTGCTKVSEGCRHCYAETMVKRFGRVGPETLPGVHPVIHDFRVMLHPDRLEQPLHWRKPRRIFVNSMSDLFHKDVPEDFIDLVFGVMAAAVEHTFMVLTKRPERMLEYMTPGGEGSIELWGSRWPRGMARACFGESEPTEFPLPNVWLGVSVEDQATADERIPLLLKTPAAVRFVSVEPMLGPVNLHMVPILVRGPRETALRQLDWVICGCESGPKARPMDPSWARSLKDQCAKAGVPFFYKQAVVAGKLTKLPHIDGEQWAQFPAAAPGEE